MKHWLILLYLVVLGTCSSNPVVPTPKFLGLLEVHIEGIGEGSVRTASARFVDVMNARTSRSATVLPVNGTAAVNDIQVTRRDVGFLDDDTNALRYVTSHFNLLQWQLNRRESYESRTTPQHHIKSRASNQ